MIKIYFWSDIFRLKLCFLFVEDFISPLPKGKQYSRCAYNTYNMVYLLY